MRIRGAIFDLDGTLLDSMSVWDTLAERYLRSLGVSPRPDLNRRCAAMSLDQAARYFQREYGVTRSVEEMVADVNAMLERYYRLEAPLRPGVAEALDRFGRAGVRMCVATATDRPLAEAALARCGVLSRFEAVFTCGEVGHGKDRPEIFQAALAALGTAREETVVCEDALHAIRTAKEAGFPVVAVYESHQSSGEEIRALADLYLEDWTRRDRLEALLPEGDQPHQTKEETP